MTWDLSHVHIARGAAALAAAMGIGRFVYTPILPMMTAQAGLSPGSAGQLATANYVGYLAGALAGVAAPRLIRTTATWRLALVAVVASLALMPLTHSVIVWLAIRAMAGLASAVLFVIAVDWMLDHARGRRAQLTGWGFGGIGVGIALSGAVVLMLPASGWRRGTGSHRCGAVRRDLHRREHHRDGRGPDTRPPPDRRGAHQRVLSRSDPGTAAGDSASAPRLPVRAHHIGRRGGGGGCPCDLASRRLPSAAPVTS